MFVCGSLYGSSTEQCAAAGATPHRVRLVPADRACKGIGFPCAMVPYIFLHTTHL